MRLVYCLLSRPGVSAAGHRYGIQRAIPSARTRFAPPSPLRLAEAGLRNIDRMSIRRACQAGVEAPTHPEPISVVQGHGLSARGFPPPLSLLIPAFAFPAAPGRLAARIRRGGNAPYQSALLRSPRLRAGAYARLLSTRGSTSELLRTL